MVCGLCYLHNSYLIAIVIITLGEAQTRNVIYLESYS